MQCTLSNQLLQDEMCQIASSIGELLVSLETVCFDVKELMLDIDCVTARLEERLGVDLDDRGGSRFCWGSSLSLVDSVDARGSARGSPYPPDQQDIYEIEFEEKVEWMSDRISSSSSMSSLDDNCQTMDWNFPTEQTDSHGQGQSQFWNFPTDFLSSSNSSLEDIGDDEFGSLKSVSDVSSSNSWNPSATTKFFDRMYTSLDRRNRNDELPLFTEPASYSPTQTQTYNYSNANKTVHLDMNQNRYWIKHFGKI